MPATQVVGASTAIRAFEVGFAESELADLRRRIEATRWPERETVDDDSQGVPLATMQELARYWATDYDWRRCEAKLNALPNFLTEIDGLDIHFIHVRSRHEDALPLIVTHGWPGSIIEQLKIIEPLTDPDGARRQRGGRVPSGDPLAAGPRVLRQADRHRLGSGAHRTGLGGADEAPRLHRVRGAGRRLGRGRHAGDGHPGARRSCSASTPTCPAPPRPTSSRAFQRGDPPPSGSLRRGATRVRAAEHLLCQARGLRADHVDAPADAVRTGGLARRSRGVHARPRRRHRPARARASRSSRDACRATSRETTSSTTSRSTG